MVKIHLFLAYQKIDVFFIHAFTLSFYYYINASRTPLKLAAGLGFEPRYTPPEGVVLPLDDPAMVLTVAKK